MSTRKTTTKKPGRPASSIRYESAKLEGVYPALDAIAWMDAPSVAQIAQYCGSDPRTIGKLLKNGQQIGLIGRQDEGYVLLSAYPYDGSSAQKQNVLQEALLRLPILVSMRQFLALGEEEDAALRKAATVNNVVPFNAGDFAPLVEWARKLEALDAKIGVEDVIEQAVEAKDARHGNDSKSRIAFLSHSSADKSFVRQLATDLKARGIGVWLDEQRIHVGESIPERVSQGLAESDFFLIVVSQNSEKSEWVKKELNSALVTEVSKRKVHILPVKLDETEMPSAIADKKYANFSASYKTGLDEVVAAIEANSNG